MKHNLVENWKDAIIERYESHADVHSESNFVALLNALESAYQAGQKDMLDRVLKDYGLEFSDGCGCCMTEGLNERLKKDFPALSQGDK